MFRPIISAVTFSLLLTATGSTQEVPALTPTELERAGIAAPTVASRANTNSSADTLVSKLLDETVFTSLDDDAAEIGTVQDLVVTPGIGISAVVIGVGGFLGIGAKTVAVQFAQLQWPERADGTHRWVLETTPEALLAAPAFIWADSEEVTGEPALTSAQEQDQLLEGDPNITTVDPTLTTDQPERQIENADVDSPVLTDFDGTSLTDEEMFGIAVYGINDQQFGTIGDVLRNTDGSLDAVIVDVGGFLGLGAKPVAVGYENLTFSADTSANRYLFLNTTRDQLEAHPTYDPATYHADRAGQRMIITP